MPVWRSMLGFAVGAVDAAGMAQCASGGDPGRRYCSVWSHLASYRLQLFERSRPRLPEDGLEYAQWLLADAALRVAPRAAFALVRVILPPPVSTHYCDID